MNFFDKVTGNDITREFKNFENRAMKLPLDYQETWIKIEKEVWKYSDFTGRNLISFLEDILTFLEESAAQGLNVEKVLGDDIETFCLELIGKENSNMFRDKCRRQLNANIEKKLKKLGENDGYKKYN